MAIGAARDDVNAARQQHFRQSPRVIDHQLRVSLKLRLQGFAEGNSFGRNHMHQRAALKTGEHCRIDLFAQVGIGRKDHTAARAAQGFMGRRRHDMGVRHRVRVGTACNQTGEMGHIDHQVRADLIGNRPHPGKIDHARVGRAATDDNLRLMGDRQLFHFIVIDQLVLLTHLIANRLEPFTRLIGGRAVGEMATASEIHTQERIARLHQREEYRLIGLGARMGLHVGISRAEQLAGAFNGDLLSNIDKLAAAVITATGVAFGILIRQHRTLGFQDGTGNDVFRRDQFDLIALAVQLLLNRLVDRRIGIGQGTGEKSSR